MLAAMVWRSDTAFLEGLGFFSDMAVQLQASDWERPSPCSGWRELDVLGHLGSAVGFGTKLLRDDKPVWEPVEPPGAAVEGDPASWWKALVAPAREAVSRADLSRVIDTPMGPRNVGEGLRGPGLDLFVHAWDLGRGVGIDVEIPLEVIELAHAVIDPIPVEQVRSPRVFAKEVAPPTGATETQSFIAWTGRDPCWAPAS